MTNNTPSAPLNSASTKPLYATIRSSYTPKPSSTREILLLFAVQYAWLIRKTRMCCACCLIVVISFMSSVLTRGYSNMLRARVSELASCWDGSFSGAVLKRSYSIHKTLTCGNKINYHIRISSFFGNEVVASPPLRDSFKHEKSGFEARAKVPTFCSWMMMPKCSPVRCTTLTPEQPVPKSKKIQKHLQRGASVWSRPNTLWRLSQKTFLQL